jgi:hypothetical protein
MTEERGDGDALSGKESAADTPPMPFIFILVAFAVVAVLIVIGMRQRWIPGPGDGGFQVHADGGRRALGEDGSRVPSRNRLRSHVRSGSWRWSAGVSS